MKTSIISIAAALALMTAAAGCGPTVRTASADQSSRRSDGYITTETASIDHSEVSEMDQVTYRTLEDYLLAKVSGIELSSGGDIIIRGMGTFNGSSKPLILFDGAEVFDTSTVNPVDIHSVDVIKDGSTASYGMRGSNGVILITSKAAYQTRQAEKEARRREKEAAKAAKAARRK